MDLDQIEKLNDLKQKGLISEEEYQQAKERILGAQSQRAASLPPHTILQTNNYDYAMVLHLTQFCSWLFPFLGLIVPLIMWQSKKEDAYVDEQGKVVMNWVFSSLIYFLVSALLCLIVVGFFLMAILLVCSIVFTIMGAINANKGVVKNYPMAIKFFDVRETPTVPAVIDANKNQG
jgi:uncharacterized Tic20 family protein